MFTFLVPALFEVISYCAGHPDVIKRLIADIEGLAHGHPANATQDATIALQAGIAAAKATAMVTVQARISAVASAAGAALAAAPPPPPPPPVATHAEGPVHIDLTGDGA